MTDWMNELEGELQSLQPRSASRDLVTAALVAHRDSEVLRAVRLRNELTSDQLESVLLVLAESHPELMADSSDEAGSVALAFVRTPQADAVPASPPVTTSTVRTGPWVRGLAMAAALLLCFVGGMATGVRPSGEDENLAAATKASHSGDGAVEDGAIELVSNVNPESGQELATEPRKSGIRIEPAASFDPQHLRRAAYGHRRQHGRSSLTEMNAAFQAAAECFAGSGQSLERGGDARQLPHTSFPGD